MRTLKNVRLALLILLLIMIQPTIHAHADQITLINGSQISGEILVISDNKIRLMAEYIGEIEVDFDKVESLSTDKSASITLKNGELINGKIDSISGNQIIITSEALGVIEVERSQLKSLNEARPTEKDLAELEQTQEALAGAEAALAGTEKDLDKEEQEIEDLSSSDNLWSGSTSLGVKLERGNSNSSDFHFEAKALRETPRKKLDLRLRLDYEKTNGEADTNEAFSSAKLQAFKTDRRYVFGMTALEHDEFEDLDLRVQTFAGPGYYFIRKEGTDLFGEIGGGIVGEYFDGADKTIEGAVWLHLEWRQKVFEVAEFVQALSAMPSVSEGGDFRARYETTLRTPMGEHWALKLSILDDYDSTPEGEDVSKNDLSLISSLEYTF